MRASVIRFLLRGRGTVRPCAARVIRRTAALALLGGLALCLAACSAAADAQPACPFIAVAQAPVETGAGLPVVRASIGAMAVTMVIDTGAARSLLSEAAARRLGLPRDPYVATRTQGVGGISSAWNAVTGSVRIGGANIPMPEMSVAELALPVDGLLGADIWRRFDADLDLPRRLLTLYRAEPCRRSAPPWTQPSIGIDGVNGGPPERLLLPAAVDGMAGPALFDTGSEVSAVSTRLAGRLAYEPEPIRKLRVRGVNAAITIVPGRRFARVQIGPFLYRDAVLPVLDMPLAAGDLLVGEDMLRGCRTWFSFAARQVFVGTGAQGALACTLAGAGG